MAEDSSKEDLKSASIGMFDAQLLSAKGFRDISTELANDRMMGNMVAATDTTRYMLWITASFVARSSRVLALLQEEQLQVRAACSQ